VKFLTEDADLVCAHRGVVEVKPTQTLVTIDGRRALVESDPEEKEINRCPNRGPNIKKCGKTLRVQVGYSTFIRIDGRRVCLDNVSGLTNGTPPGVVKYLVRDPGQQLVAGGA
jgi:hypothetical protein